MGRVGFLTLINPRRRRALFGELDLEAVVWSCRGRNLAPLRHAGTDHAPAPGDENVIAKVGWPGRVLHLAYGVQCRCKIASLPSAKYSRRPRAEHGWAIGADACMMRGASSLAGAGSRGRGFAASSSLTTAIGTFGATATPNYSFSTRSRRSPPGTGRASSAGVKMRNDLRYYSRARKSARQQRR